MSEIGEILEGIYQAKGMLTPQLVVDEAREETHPLHTHFEWDDQIAGQHHRLSQARQLIRAVRVVEVSGADGIERIRGFHSVPRPEGRTYVPVAEVKGDPFTRELVLRQAEREWRQMLRRYRDLEEFMAVVRKDVAVVA